MFRQQKKGRLYMSYRKYTNNAVQKAVLEIVEQGISIRSASEKYGVPKSTLNDRLQKTNAEITVKQIQQEGGHLGEVIPTPIRLCIVCRCRRSAERRFHRFPESKRRKKKWLEALQLEQKHISINSSVCSRHFRPEDYCYRKSTLAPAGKKKCLKTDAVPSQFLDGEDQITSFFITENENNNIPSTSELNQNSTDDDELESTNDILKNSEQIESFIELKKTEKPSPLSKKLKDGTLIKPINTEILQKTHIKHLEKRITEAEGRVEELENLYGKRKRDDTWDSNNKESMRTDVLQTTYIKFLEQRLAEEEGKVQELENHCKNLCNIAKSQNETISILRSRLKSAEKEKTKIQSIKVQEILTSVAICNQELKKNQLSDSD